MQNTEFFFTRLVFRILTETTKWKCTNIWRKLWYEHKNDKFFFKILTGDESLVYHTEPENNRLSMKYCHYDSRGPKYIRRQILLTIMLIWLWDVNVVVNLVFVLPGVTINSGSYVGINLNQHDSNVLQSVYMRRILKISPWTIIYTYSKFKLTARNTVLLKNPTAA